MTAAALGVTSTETGSDRFVFARTDRGWQALHRLLTFDASAAGAASA